MRRKSEKPYWANVCRHFTNGVDVLHDKCCSKGVKYIDVTAKPNEPGSSFRLACHAPNDEHGLKVLAETGPAGTCEHFSALTQEEIDKQEAESDAAFEESLRRMRLAEPIVSAFRAANRVGKKFKSASTVVDCPVCGTGKLHMSHSGHNGHVWGKCTTDGCLGWME